MRRPLLALAIGLLLAAGCRTASLPQFCGLEQGMRESDFASSSLDQKCHIDRTFYSHENGGMQYASAGSWDANGNMTAPQTSGGPGYGWPARSVTIHGDVWTIWSYRVGRTFSRSGHDEYAVFKNKRLVSWDLGRPPREVLEHPESAASN